MPARTRESYFAEARKCRVIVLEDLDFVWDEEELEDIAFCWQEGMSVRAIANRFKRDPDEILLALIHLAREERIKQREKGLMGVSV
ncbi:MAG: hypothetical protein ACQEXB_18575 [Bacillota bacterium]